jgi:hypothetical protein
MLLLFRRQRQIWTRINADLHGFDTTNWQQSSLIRVDAPLSASNAFAFSSPTADLDTDQSRFTWIRHNQPATIRFIRVHPR